MDDTTWERVILALLSGVGGFIGGLFTKLLTMIFPPYTDLVKENADLKSENRQLREDKNGLEDDVDQLTERLRESQSGTSEHKTTVGL